MSGQRNTVKTAQQYNIRTAVVSGIGVTEDIVEKDFLH